MAAAMKSVLVVMLIALVAQNQFALSQAQAQSCSNTLTSLNICAPFVVPGAAATTPSADCCGALRSIDRECMCNTLRVAARIPAQCNLPPLNCGN